MIDLTYEQVAEIWTAGFLIVLFGGLWITRRRHEALSEVDELEDSKNWGEQ